MHHEFTPNTSSENLDSHELAWAAGFFDGEGTTCINNGTPKGQRRAYAVIVVGISQTNEESLQRFRRAIGGLGIINGPYIVSRDDRHKPQWRFRASGRERVETIIGRLWPYLGSIKQEQAKKAIETMRGIGTRPVGAPTKEFCVHGHDLGIHGRKRNDRKRTCGECERLNSLAAYYRRKGDDTEAKRVLDGTHVSRKGWRRYDKVNVTRE